MCTVGVNGNTVWSKDIGNDNNEWNDAEIDLSAFGGRRVMILMSTHARDTDDAWIGWGEPIIWADKLTERERIRSGLIKAIEKRFIGNIARHP